MTNEMIKLRTMLTAEGIPWEDASDKADDIYHIDRTHFEYRKYSWSIIHGYGTYGGHSLWNDDKDEGKLELMSNAVNGGDPVGWLTADECMALVKGE